MPRAVWSPMRCNGRLPPIAPSSSRRWQARPGPITSCPMDRPSSSMARTRARRRAAPRCRTTTSRCSCRRSSPTPSRASRPPDFGKIADGARHGPAAIDQCSIVLSPVILIPALLNGLMTGAVYALVALGLTLIYGVLHIINFAHGALLTAAMFAAYFAYKLLGLAPYIAALFLTPIFFCLGYALQRCIIGPAAHGEDRNILLGTLGLAVVSENALLYSFRADTR